ncbi:MULTISPECIES: hypothetical protein [unclassified Jeotgalibaca]|uniref:hypothetical protein n=1 Tax=unclassified Jeotgalibaca TaxID=2621505 RepID=UPI003FD0A691
MEKKSAKETLEHMKPKPENDSPPRSWFYILVGVILIFGLTFIFQELNNQSEEMIDPSSFEQLKEQVQELNHKVTELEHRIEDLES